MRCVALSIDTSRALRTQVELTSLVEAVRDAPKEEPETDNVEWKSDWDLSDARVRFDTARHLLGFGNRTVFAAEQQFEGCAYILAGVEPGNLVGMEPLDPAEIDDHLSKYVSSGQPRWSPSYVTVDGKSVLVLTIEAPRTGDAIFTLQRGYANWPAGRVFVRRHGKTEEAGPADIRALEARGQASRPRVELEVSRADEVRLRAVEFSEDVCQRWVAAERARLMRPFAPRPEPTGLGHSLGIANRPPVSQIMWSSDTRSREAYQEEVAEYVDAAARYWRAAVAALAIQNDLAPVRLQIQNPTVRNFDGVEVVVEVPLGVQAWVSDDEPFEVFDAPSPPEPWNEQRLALFSRPRLRSLRPHAVVERHSAGSRVRFAPCHVRPGETIRLLPIYLVISAGSASRELHLAWRLTSTGADGWRDGGILYEVDPQPERLTAPAGNISLFEDD